MEEEVRHLLKNKQKINAVKLVRERTGVGLKEAKEYVDAVEKGLRPPDLQTSSHGDSSYDSMYSYDSTSSDIRGEVQYLLGQGKKIEAVKFVRERTGMGLKEAKEYVDSLG